MTRLITVAGPPSSGKTSILLKTIQALQAGGLRVGVAKFDCLSTEDDVRFQQAGIPVVKGLSGSLCPDHFFVSNIEEVLQWGLNHQFSFLFTESAGLCNRCSPYIKEITSLCVIDQLSGVHTPKKIGPMLKLADMIVVTKGDIVSQAEREVFFASIETVNPRAQLIPINGLTGQGAQELAMMLMESDATVATLKGKELRFSMPAALCSYCLGETRIGDSYQQGNVKKMEWKALS
jgi:Ni2+-binding GTPase involved in maturation of urease and hydrogenase